MIKLMGADGGYHWVDIGELKDVYAIIVSVVPNDETLVVYKCDINRLSYIYGEIYKATGFIGEDDNKPLDLDEVWSIYMTGPGNLNIDRINEWNQRESSEKWLEMVKKEIEEKRKMLDEDKS